MVHRPGGRAWMVAIVVALSACSSSANTAPPTRPLSSTEASTDTSRDSSATTRDSAGSTDSAGTAATTRATTTPVQRRPDDLPTSTAEKTTTTATTATTPGTEALGTTTTASPTPTTQAAPDDTPGAPCAFTPPAGTGEVTFIKNGQLRAVSGFVGTECLVDGVSTAAPVSWSSDASHVLTDPAMVSDVSGTKPTGFPIGDTGVALSGPSGTASISVDPNTHRLIKHSVNGTKTQDISFLAETDAAIYHPSGTRIVAIGTDEGGTYGVWLATNEGKGRKLITSIVDPAIPVTNLSWSADTSTLYFVRGFVHSLVINGLVLTAVGTDGRQEGSLTVSKVEDALAWSFGPCDATGSVVMRAPVVDGVVDLRTMPNSPFLGSPQTLRPVGWLSGYKLVVAARDTGCDGPADVWTWSPFEGFQHIGHDWTSPAVRLQRGNIINPPDVIEQQAPG